ncbi:DUF3347 domain-containing protein [Limnovirga soli]|uniref:DUF3347 domain-containing protein n=1 Tax=Limnovirga soli TaxID=2656915 RepID=A0A8J8FFG4_9BACT|nr:DUF3347 domain-containing protein [Limnovirga soli]NNV55853.1 DUF3347 domain-containing protein [Limnovirga soli]
MKKGLGIIGFAIVILAVYLVVFNKSENEPGEPKQQALTQSTNSDMFNNSFSNMLNAYFDLKDAFVNWDTIKINGSAKLFQASLKAINYETLMADTTILATATDFSNNTIAETINLANAETIVLKRHFFYDISENVYNLIKTVRYDQRVIYHEKCPMAFNDKEEAYWISDTNAIINPYLGNKHPIYKSAMLNCGSVEDSIDFRP